MGPFSRGFGVVQAQDAAFRPLGHAEHEGGGASFLGDLRGLGEKSGFGGKEAHVRLWETFFHRFLVGPGSLHLRLRGPGLTAFAMRAFQVKPGRQRAVRLSA
ncbi:hypothetical protein [Thermus amyloliquefaciens]|uniref:hypothetical protein n=1 Tax=Thermus amyloliquefaciens TaxID=1449080 RepID=UPI00163A7211|nr:hypothetical protein [Thermus amyloliquefaciens]